MAEGACGAGDEEECRAHHHHLALVTASPPLRRRGSDGAPRRAPRPSPTSPSFCATAPPSPALGASPRPLRPSCARVLPRVAPEVALSLATSSALLARLSRMWRAGTFPFGRAPPLFGGGGGAGVGSRALDAAAASFWSASLALPDGILWWGLGWMGRTLGRTAGGGRRASLGAAAVLLPLLTAVVVATCTLETATLWYARRAAPWDLACDVWNNWAAYRGMGASKTGELGAVMGCEVGGAVAIFVGRRACAGRSPRSTERLWMHLKHRVRGRRKFHENGNNDTATRVEKGLGRQRSACARSRRSGVFYVSGRDRRWQRAVVFLACASAVRFRPDEPYGSASGSTYLEAPVEISQSFVRGWRQRRRMAEAKAKHSAETARIVPAQYTDDGRLKNVAVVFLESARADLFPFDHTTEWAKEKVLPSVLEEASQAAREGRPNTITPFYAALTRNGTASLYLPIKSTSGTTLKSVLATLCGAYPHPSDHTFRERYHGIYQRCLSHFMEEKRGASSKFFLSMHTGFDDQFALVDKMGFGEGIYGKEQYDEDHNLTERGDRMAFERLHNANYFGYEDNVLFDTVMDWVDRKAAAKLPFFLVYEAGITHHPFESPPNWPHKTYSENKMVDGFLNEAAYLDDFLGRFLGGFEARNLMTNTLFVLVGDHGVALGDRGVDNLMAVGWEGAFNVGLTFHTGNEIAAERLKKVAEEHRRLNRDAAVGGRSKGTYGSIDVLPTVLDLLDHPDVTSPREGRSLLRPPYNGRTLSLSFINPGSDLVLREGDWVCASSDKGWGQPSLYDLSVDPKQERPIRLSSGAEKEDQLSSLERWGAVAAKFMALLRNDLDSAYSNGRRCENCTLSVLASSDPLDRWHCSETESESAAESNADSSGSDDMMMFNDWQQKTVVCQPTTSSK